MKKIILFITILLSLSILSSCNVFKSKDIVNVTFIKNDETSIIKEVRKGETIDPIWIDLPGYYLEGWYLDEVLENRFDFTTPIEKDLTLYSNTEKICYTITIDSNLDDIAPGISESIIQSYNKKFIIYHNELFNLNSLVYDYFGQSLSNVYTDGRYTVKEIKLDGEVLFHNETEWSSNTKFDYLKNIELEFVYYNRAEEVDKTEKAYFDNLLQSDDTLIKHESGIVYKVLTEGTGMSPTLENIVVVNYKGTLIDGTVFDQNNNVSFELNGVIEGFKTILQIMKPGEKVIVYIPYSLGYGSRSMSIIPAYSTLIFEIELIEVK